MVRQKGRRYELRLSTPSISFAPDPRRPDAPTYEQEYHARAARQFKDALAPLDGPLDDAIDEVLEVLLREHPELVLVAPGASGAYRVERFVGSPPDLDAGLDHGMLTLAFANELGEAQIDRVFQTVLDAMWTILRTHHEQKREAARRGPAPSDPQPFHYTRAADGTIDDLNGAAPGRPLGETPLDTRAVLELCAAIAAVVAIAEDDGVVHADLEASNIRIDGPEVSIGGFGERISSKRGHPPEGTADLRLPVRGSPIDWTARQRYSLGHVLFEVIGDAEVAPSLRALIANLRDEDPRKRPSARAAWAVIAALVDPSPAPPSRSSPTKAPARRAAETPGVLDTCRTCGRPALRNAGRNAGTRDDYGPDCCYFDRERRNLRIGAAVLFAIIAAVIAWLVR